jgi:DNA polymerase-3 subunit epsilon
MGKGFAVIDVETTGFSPEKHDRIVEIGIVHVSPAGEVEGRYETIVNPQRDMGPQHIHGISAAAASRAPLFDQIAGDVAGLLDDRVPVAHNAVFDSRFLGFQMAQSGVTIPGRDRWLCTLRLSQSVTGFRSLAECCSAMGVEQLPAHSAGGDAFSTALLLRAYMESGLQGEYWTQWLASAQSVSVPVHYTHVDWMPREVAFRPEPSFLERVTNSLETKRIGAHLNVDYLALLDRVMLDTLISAAEADSLIDLARGLDLTADDVQAAHRAYFDGLVTTAWSDHILTPAEAAEIRAAGRLLGIDDESVEHALSTERDASSAALPLSSGFHLVAGDSLVLTGEMSKPREVWESLLAGLGFDVRPNVVKKTKVLVAADPDSLSGKAKKAREYGIPIVNEAGLERLLGL